MEALQHQAQIDPAMIQQFQPGVYGARVETPAEFEVTAQEAEVARATGAAMLDASSYADPTQRGILYAKHALASDLDQQHARMLAEEQKEDELV